MRKRPLLTIIFLLFPLLSVTFSAANPAAEPLTEDWFYESDQDTADLGYAVDGEGDYNNDGYADVVVGAIKYAATSIKGGAVFVFYGGPGGLQDTPDWSFGVDMNGAELGTAVANAGDVNGDKIDDLLVSAPSCTNPEPKEGCIYLFYGSNGGLNSAPDWTYDSDLRDSYLGTAVDGAGDVNGDEYADVIVGAKWYANGQGNEGAAFVFYGSETGLGDAPDWHVEGNQAGASMGTAVAGAGDVNGDGFDDVLVGAPWFDDGGDNVGAAYLFLGSATGLGDTPVWQAQGSQEDTLFGQAVASAGDVNGDGRADIIIGAPGYQNNKNEEVGAAFVYLGTAIGATSSPMWTAVSDQPLSRFGHAVNCAGDMNQDGFADVVIGAYQYTQDQAEEGMAFIYLGAPFILTSQPLWTAEGNKSETMLGFAVGPGGDVDKDGFADLVIGAPEYRNQTELRGRAFLYRGKAFLVPNFPVFLPIIQR